MSGPSPGPQKFGRATAAESAGSSNPSAARVTNTSSCSNSNNVTNSKTPPSSVPPPFGPSNRHAKRVSDDDKNPPCNTLFVGGIPSGYELHVQQLMSDPTLNFVVIRFMPARRGRGDVTAMVKYIDKAHAARAKEYFYGHTLGGVVGGGIRVSFARNSLDRRENESTDEERRQERAERDEATRRTCGNQGSDSLGDANDTNDVPGLPERLVEEHEAMLDTEYVLPDIEECEKTVLDHSRANPDAEHRARRELLGEPAYNQLIAAPSARPVNVGQPWERARLAWWEQAFREQHLQQQTPGQAGRNNSPRASAETVSRKVHQQALQQIALEDAERHNHQAARRAKYADWCNRINTLEIIRHNAQHQQALKQQRETRRDTSWLRDQQARDAAQKTREETSRVGFASTHFTLEWLRASEKAVTSAERTRQWTRDQEALRAGL